MRAAFRNCGFILARCRQPDADRAVTFRSSGGAQRLAVAWSTRAGTASRFV